MIRYAPLQRTGGPLQEALDHVKMVRPCAKPNVNFMQQLQMLEMVGHYPYKSAAERERLDCMCLILACAFMVRWCQAKEREECAMGSGHGMLML